jgi:Fe-S-cluster containining protein
MLDTKKQVLFRPVVESKIQFRCHKDIACFTRCCAELDLVLTPYDIVRLKNRLGTPSDAFLDQYTVTNWKRHPRFPMINLKMDVDRNGKCPFVTPQGCTIYEDRPGACRIYPIGRAALKLDMERGAREKFFIVDEEHCLGFGEDREWTLEEWMANEGVDEYNLMNDQWLEIITSQKRLGRKEDIARKIQMFYMASYNLDVFRRLIFESRFFHIFRLEAEEREKLATDDVSLMQFAFDWLRFSLFGEKTIQMKS